MGSRSNKYKYKNILFESTLFHELTHYGDATDGNMDMTKYVSDGNGNWRPVSHGTHEGGKQFEKAAYGYDINSENAVDIAKRTNYALGKYAKSAQKQINSVRGISNSNRKALKKRFVYLFPSYHGKM